MEVANTWVFVDNTRPPGKKIAALEVGGNLTVTDNRLWQQLTVQYMKPRVQEQAAIPSSDQQWTSDDIIDAVNRAVTRAVKRHKERGESIVIWRDGRIVTLGPDEIEV